MDAYSIYKLTSPSGRSYVGLTKQSVENRWRQHVARAYKEQRNHPLYNAIRKYGASSFTVEKIDGADSLEAAKELEILHISELVDPYNVSRGGEYDGVDGVKKFWDQIREDPQKYGAYVRHLSAGCSEARSRNPELVRSLTAAAKAWAMLNPRKAYEISRRALRIAGRKTGLGPPRGYWAVPHDVLNIPRSKEDLLRKYKPREARSEAAIRGWANSTEESRMKRAQSISSSRKKYFSNLSVEEKSAITKKARDNIDREKQSAAASAGLKSFWENLRKDPEAYEAYINRRRESLLRRTA